MVEKGLPSRIKEHSVQVDSTQNEYDVWRPSRLNFEADSLNVVERQTAEIYKTTISVLNKVTTENYSKLACKLENLQIYSILQMQGVIDIIINKAINEPEFCSIYAALCVPMQSRIVENEFGRKISFLKLLHKKCRENSKNFLLEEVVFSQKKNLISMCTDMELKKKMFKVYETEEYLSRKKCAGNCRFIGELFKLNLVQIYVINSTFEKCFESGGPLALECIYTLMKTIGEFYEETYEKLPEKFLKKIEFFSTSEKSTSRIRFLLLNVLELRANSWKPGSKVQSSMPDENTPVGSSSEASLVSSDMQEICNNIFMSYLTQNPKEEISLSMKNFKSEQLIEVVFVLIKQVINTDSKNCEQLGKMFVELIEKRAISIADLIGGLSMFLTSIREDHVSPDLERILSPLFTNDVIQFEDLMGVFEQFQQKKHHQSLSASIPKTEMNKSANKNIPINNPQEKNSADETNAALPVKKNSAILVSTNSVVSVVTKSADPDVTKPAIQIGTKLAAPDAIKPTIPIMAKMADPIVTKPTVSIPVQPSVLVTTKPKSAIGVETAAKIGTNLAAPDAIKPAVSIMTKTADPIVTNPTVPIPVQPVVSVSVKPSILVTTKSKSPGVVKPVVHFQDNTPTKSATKTILPKDAKVPPLMKKSSIDVTKPFSPLSTSNTGAAKMNESKQVIKKVEISSNISSSKKSSLPIFQQKFITILESCTLENHQERSDEIRKFSLSLAHWDQLLDIFMEKIMLEDEFIKIGALLTCKLQSKRIVEGKSFSNFVLQRILTKIVSYFECDTRKETRISLRMHRSGLKSLIVDQENEIIRLSKFLAYLYRHSVLSKSLLLDIAMSFCEGSFTITNLQCLKEIYEFDYAEKDSTVQATLKSQIEGHVRRMIGGCLDLLTPQLRSKLSTFIDDFCSKQMSKEKKSTKKAVKSPPVDSSLKHTSVPSKPTNKIVGNPSNASSSKHISVPSKATNKTVENLSVASSSKHTSVPTLKEQFVTILETSSVDNHHANSQKIKMLSISNKDWEQLINVFMEKILRSENFVQTGALLTCKLQTLKIGNNDFGNLIVQRCVSYVLNYLIYETEKKVIVDNMSKKDRRKLKTFTAEQEKELLLLCKFISFLYGYSLLSKSLLLDIISSFCDGISLITNLKCLCEIYQFGFEEKDASIREAIKTEIKKPVRRMMNDCCNLMPPELLFKLQTFVNAVNEASRS